MKPEVKQAGKEQIKKKCQRIHQREAGERQIDADRKNRSDVNGGAIASTKTGYGAVRHLDFRRKPRLFVLLRGREIEWFETVKAVVTTRQSCEILLWDSSRTERVTAWFLFHDDRHPSMKVDRRFHCCCLSGNGRCD